MLITIEELLKYLDLDFEPRFITKDRNGAIWAWSGTPKTIFEKWQSTSQSECKGNLIGARLKLSEFDGKDWTKCIYEVPRKVDYTKYMGRVCRFWNGDNPRLFKNIGILVGIDPEPRPFLCASKPKKRFEHCEPVRPDDDVIYKGE